MAIGTMIVWDGDTDNDVNVDTNFNAAPDNNTVIIPAYSDGGDDTLTAAAAFPTGGTIARLIIEEGGSYTIGTRAAPITVNMASATTADINIGGTGTYFLTPVNWDTITITEAGPAPGDGQYAVNLTGMTHDAATSVGAIHVLCEDNMSVGIGAEKGATTEVETIFVSGGDVTVGLGCVQLEDSDAPDLTITGGNVVTHCTLGAVVIEGGTLTIMAGAMDSLTVDGGTVYYRSDGACPVPVISGAGTIDFSRDLSSRTFGGTTQTTVYPGATIIDPAGTVTWTGGIDIIKGRLEDVNIDIGENINIAKGATGL